MLQNNEFRICFVDIGWKILMWLQRAWPADLPAAVISELKNVDVYNTRAELIYWRWRRVGEL